MWMTVSRLGGQRRTVGIRLAPAGALPFPMFFMSAELTQSMYTRKWLRHWLTSRAAAIAFSTTMHEAFLTATASALLGPPRALAWAQFPRSLGGASARAPCHKRAATRTRGRMIVARMVLFTANPALYVLLVPDH